MSAADGANPGHGEDPRRVVERLGLADAEYLILDSRGAGGETQSRAHLAFRQDRQGVASWLAEPAPVGALDFVSPNAHLAVGGILKEPAEMMDDLLALVEADDSGGEHSLLRELADFEAEHGLSLREDLVATLGGDFAFAFDGPWLPTPSWKLVLEVNDAGRLQSTLATLVEEWNRDAATAEGEPRPTLSLSQEAIDGRVVYDLRTSNGNDLAHFLFVDGYRRRRTLAGPARRGGRAARRRRHPRRLVELPRSSAARRPVELLRRRLSEPRRGDGRPG